MPADFSRGFATKLDSRITLLTALLVALLSGGAVSYWILAIRPALLNDAQSNTRFQSQALANQLGDLLSPGIDAEELADIGKTMERMLLFEHPTTRQAFLERIELEFDPELVDISAQDTLLVRGEAACASCFVAEVPVYAARSRELMAIGRFFASDGFFRSLQNDVQQRLLQALAALFVMLGLFWWLMTRLLRPLNTIARHLRAQNLTELSALPPLGGGASTELIMIKEAFDGLLHRLRDYTASLTSSRDQLEKQARERAELVRELEGKNAELERFTYTVSHDLKSPLITIRGFAGLLEADLDAGNRERVSQDLRQICQATDMMRALLDDLLELSRIGRMVNPSEQVDLPALTRDALTMVTGRIEARQAEIVIGSESPPVFGDRQRLLEVFINLIDNAVKFVEDEKKPRVSIAFEERPLDVVCHISDNGRGILPRYHEKVFGLFDRLDPETEGTGIGLALVKRIIELHGGNIWIESDGNGRGCCVSFTLPRATEESA